MDQARLPIEDDKGYLVRIRFQEFLQTYGSENSQLMKEANEELTQQMILENYMLQIEYMIHWNKSTVFVNFEHLMKADAELAEAVEFDFYRFEPYLRHAIYNIVVVDNKNYVYDVDKGPREFFVAFYNMPTVEKIRTVRTSKIGRLVSISGTVTRTSEVRPELYYGCFICRNCGTTIPSVEQQFQYTEPIVCKNPQCSDGAKDFQLITDKSLFIDWQRLRIQENADEIPAGSMPRSLEVICRNEIVEVAKAGDKIVLTGTVIVLPDTSGVGRAGETAVSSKKSSGNEVDGVQGLKKLGVKEMAYKLSFIASSIQITDRRSGKANNHHVIPFFNESVNQTDYNPASNSAFDNSEEIPNFTQQDLKMIENMFHLPNLYSAMAESICPAVFGHLEVKRGILLMLLGGVHKKTLEGISLRGDINVCIVGDPSCAKSQFLKYVHGFLPRTIYTSGKSSSAAGLTASVVRDAETGEFCVEAGALMLADNGICCIDEFDKMDAADQVAIHEAMEQQTISITKAGIQATLNARTSILAAANPVFGRYDKTKTLKANIAISAAIMSRFDLFFIILDECDKTSDEKIARHIVSIHKADGINRANTEVKFSREQLQKYITFARTINPEFNERSRKTLVECYRLLRQNDMLGKNKTAYRITVRQLESLIRLSEALARLHLNQIVEEAYVKEAFRLLQKSIIFVESESIQLDEEEEDGGMNGMEEDGIDHHVNMEEVMNDEIERHLQTDPKSFSELMSNVNVVDADRNKTPVPTTTEQQQSEAAAAVEDPSKAKDKEKEKDKKGNKQKTQISAKEYEEITDLLKYHLKHLEDEDPDNFHGCSWKDLTTWYLTEHCKDILNDESAIEGKKKIVNQIIRRLIKHEGSIVVLQSHQEEDVEKIPNEEKILKLHPSVQI